MDAVTVSVALPLPLIRLVLKLAPMFGGSVSMLNDTALLIKVGSPTFTVKVALPTEPILCKDGELEIVNIV